MITRLFSLPFAVCFLTLASCAVKAPDLSVSCEVPKDLRAGMVNVVIRGESLQGDIGYTVTTPNEEIEQSPVEEEGALQAAFDKKTDKLISKRQFKDGVLKADYFVKGEKGDEVQVIFDLEKAPATTTAVCQ